MLKKKFIAILIALYFSLSLSAEILTLQQGVDSYAVCEDTHLMKLTSLSGRVMPIREITGSSTEVNLAF